MKSEANIAVKDDKPVNVLKARENSMQEIFVTGVAEKALAFM
jgi:hypothetical protein